MNECKLKEPCDRKGAECKTCGFNKIVEYKRIMRIRNGEMEEHDGHMRLNVHEKHD